MRHPHFVWVSRCSSAGVTVNASVVLVVMFLPKMLVLTEGEAKGMDTADNPDYNQYNHTPMKHSRDTGQYVPIVTKIEQ